MAPLSTWSCRILVVLGLAVVLTAGACTNSSLDAPAGVGVGRQAPNLQLESLDGHQVSLADYAGQVVLINFWATWCPPCKEEIPAIERAYEAHRDEGFMVLGINDGEALGVVQAFAGELGITYPVLIDRRRDVAAQYRRRGLPLTVIVDRAGVIQVRHEGYLTAGQLDRYLSRLLP
jgi:cytochrome c biogenesis protein CcmG/thiol:disulfide interchange protein DsbE